MTFRAQITERPIEALKPYPGNARTHSPKQVKQIAASIGRFGFTNPVLISDGGEIVAGHGRVEAAKLLGWKSVPTIALSHLTDAERRHVLADNKLALNAGWDREILSIELQALVDLEFDVTVTGFSLARGRFRDRRTWKVEPRRALMLPRTSSLKMVCSPVTKRGDVWTLGRHRLLCGDAQDPACFAKLLDGERADLVFTDPPYNVNIDKMSAVTVRFSIGNSRSPQARWTAFSSSPSSRALLAMRREQCAMVPLRLSAWIGATCGKCSMPAKRYLPNSKT